MTPDDPRHGTNAGYIAGCRQDCCHLAAYRYGKRRRYDNETGNTRTVPTWRGERRLQALQALGWSRKSIAAHMGISNPSRIYAIGEHPTMWRSTFEAIDRAYRELSMRTPPQDTLHKRIGVVKTKKNAAAAGYPPPLAWDNIDDENERPTGWRYTPIKPRRDRAEHLAELVAKGASATAACDALGITRNGLHQWCLRNGQLDAWSLLQSREDVPREQHNQFTKPQPTRGSAA